jgi:DNA-binding NarL/FixJ family response regulator
MSIPAEKLSLILELFLNGEMEKRAVIAAIQRLAANSFSEEESEKRQAERNKKKSYPQNDYARWDHRDEMRMMELRAQGYDYDVIARELRRTTRSVRTKYLEVRDREAVEAATKLFKKMGENVI